MNKPNHVERGGEVHADTPVKWSEDDKACQEQGLRDSPDVNSSASADQNDGKGHGALKGTDTPATTDAGTSEREHGKRTTM
jgi:hypothetical protein